MYFISRVARARKLAGVLSPTLAGRKLFRQNGFLRRTHTGREPPNLKPLNSKIIHCMRNGLVEEAQKLFDEMPHRNTFTWNVLIHGYFQNGYFDEGLHLYDQIPERDIFSCNIVMAGLMRCGNVKAAKQVFAEMPTRDIVTWNTMISGCIQNGLINEAVQVFDEMPVKDVISWNLVITALVHIKEIDLAQKLFEEMGDRDIPSWTIMVSGLASVGRVVEARGLFENMPGRDIQAWNSMIQGYAVNGYVEIAEALFWKMPEHDFDSWSALVNGMVSKGRINDAIRLFIEMPHKSHRLWNSLIMELIGDGLFKKAHAFIEKTPFRNVVSWTNLIIEYFEVGEVDSAKKLFEWMPIRDTTAWNAAIFGLWKNDLGEEGLKLFIRMRREGPSPDEATYTSILTICSDMPTLHLGKQIHADVTKMGSCCFKAVSNAMITMYGRCGNMDSALVVFSSMPSHDIISWNSLISGYAHNGNGEKALEMFSHMKSMSVKPNQITFVGVLSACRHAGLVEEGRQHFSFMKNECCLEPMPEHYTCLVDLLGRFGLINEAMSVLDQMQENGNEIPASVWGAILQACRMHKNIEVGEIAGEKVLEMEPWNTGIYVILAEMYLQSGKKDQAKRIRVRMKEKKPKKQPGCSWIEVNNCGHVFLAGESSHPEHCRICCVLNLMYMEKIGRAHV